MVRLAVNWEVRLRGNEQREGAFLKVMLDVRAVERVGTGPADQHRHQAEMGLCMRMWQFS
jgi:hypothetical protein